MKCMSCGAGLGDGSVVFECSNCKKKISRCGKCRKLSIKYTCECGMVGP